MPKGYTKIKNSLKSSGKSNEAATTEAAKIWNKQNKGTGNTVGKGRK